MFKWPACLIIESEGFFIYFQHRFFISYVFLYPSIFSQSGVCVFILLLVPLEKQKFLILVKANIIMFFFCGLYCLFQ